MEALMNTFALFTTLLHVLEDNAKPLPHNLEK